MSAEIAIIYLHKALHEDSNTA